MRLHYLQHDPMEHPGTILDWCARRGYPVTATMLCEDAPLPDQDDFDALVVMGGPMNIYEYDRHPWLRREKRFIGRAIDAGKPVLGLCLGAQLIADVIGGDVTQNPERELGWLPVKRTDEAGGIPLFSAFPAEATVFQWHGDTFSVLPAPAQVVFTGDACQNQGFVYKDRVVGLQFHLEVTDAMIAAWTRAGGDELAPGAYVQTAAEMLGQSEYLSRANGWMEQLLNTLFKERC